MDLFTKEQIELFLPKLDRPISQDEYLSMLRTENSGIDFGEILDYDPDEEAQLFALAESYCGR